MSEKSLVLVDGSYYLFRAYHAMPEFTNAKGEPTGALFGVVNMLRKLLREEQPDYFAVIFDAPGKTFRSDLFADYKAHRPPTPDDLVCQIAPLREIIEALGLPLLSIDDVEADDVIATLATQADKAGLRTLISTGDKDLAQLVNDKIHLVNTMSQTVYDREGVIKKYGVPPEKIVDYLALIGDTSDNIPGVHKVGPKTAVKWLAEHGSLENIIAAADSFGGKIGEYLRDSLQQLPLNKQLVTLKMDVALQSGPTDLIIAAQDKAALKRHYDRWGFRSWLPELNGAAADKPTTASDEPAPAEAPKQTTTTHNYTTILDNKTWQQWLKKIQAAELTAVDTETTSLNYIEAEVVGLSFATEAGQAAYLPLTHDYAGAPQQLDRDTVLAELKPWLESEQHKKAGQNLKYDKNVLANHGIELRGILYDSMLESYVLDSTAARHDMDSLAKKYLDKQTTRYEDIAGKGAKQIAFNQIPIETAAPYAAEDADITLQLHQTLWPQLQAMSELQTIYTELELPLLNVISAMERNGVQIDKAMLDDQSRELAQKMQTVEKQAYKVAGQPFNIGSPKQLQTVLYDKIPTDGIPKTPKGQLSTAESVLQELAVEHELPRLILEHRSLSKLKSTYTDKLPLLVAEKTGRVHTSYHQAVAATGRLSSSDPNLQNIPVRTEEGRKIRQAFICANDSTLLAADYSQIELRIMAHLSGDDTLLKAFRDNADIHQTTAAEVFGLQPDKVSAEQRRAAKAINFGLIYGMSAWGLARQLGINRGAAKEYVDTYFQRYPGVKQYMDSTREQARQNGYVETLFGRRLYLPEINSRNAARRQYAERTAINAPMQGTAADIIKKAMLAIDRELLQADNDIKMIMQVHDELVFEIHTKQVEKYKKTIVALMSEAAELQVPLLVDTGTGRNWDQAH
ncbi:MAG: DNA polymerase I [Gammaproteobacteria bacterium]